MQTNKPKSNLEPGNNNKKTPCMVTAQWFELRLIIKAAPILQLSLSQQDREKPAK